jgi:hypothetical protein
MTATNKGSDMSAQRILIGVAFGLAIVATVAGWLV